MFLFCLLFAQHFQQTGNLIILFTDFFIPLNGFPTFLQLTLPCKKIFCQLRSSFYFFCGNDLQCRLMFFPLQDFLLLFQFSFFFPNFPQSFFQPIPADFQLALLLPKPILAILNLFFPTLFILFGFRPLNLRSFQLLIHFFQICIHQTCFLCFCKLLLLLQFCQAFVFPGKKFFCFPLFLFLNF